MTMHAVQLVSGGGMWGLKRESCATPVLLWQSCRKTKRDGEEIDLFCFNGITEPKPLLTGR